MGLWTRDLLKDTILWFLFSGLALAFSVVPMGNDDGILRRALTILLLEPNKQCGFAGVVRKGVAREVNPTLLARDSLDRGPSAQPGVGFGLGEDGR